MQIKFWYEQINGAMKAKKMYSDLVLNFYLAPKHRKWIFYTLEKEDSLATMIMMHV